MVVSLSRARDLASAAPGTSGKPFAMASGTVAYTIPSGNNATNVTVTYPASRFSQTPILSTGMLVGGNFDHHANIQSNGSSSATVRLFTNSGTTGGAWGGTIYWVAIQMTSGAASG